MWSWNGILSRSGAVFIVEIGPRLCEYLGLSLSLSVTASRHRVRLRSDHFGDMECRPHHGTGQEVAGHDHKHVPCAAGLERQVATHNTTISTANAQL
jgi:hypothetical protein